MWRRTGLTLLVVAVLGGVAACGSNIQPIPFDSAAPSTATATAPGTVALPTLVTTAPVPTLAGDVVGSAWKDATGDLAGLPSECGNLSYLSSRPDRTGILAGVALQGVWSSDDRGATWSQLGTGTDSDEVTFRMTDVVFDPTTPSTFWISGLYNGGGLYRTSDDGITWEQVGGLGNFEDIGIDFSDPDRQTLVAPIHERMDVFRSTDGGLSWDNISAALPDEGGFVVAVEVLDADSYIVGVRLSQVPGIYRTDDAGSTWTRVYTADVVGEPLRTPDGALYWLIDRGTGLVTSTDDGITWTTVPSSSISPFATTLLQLPDGRLVTVSDNSLITSNDRGISWRPLGPPLPYDPSGIAYSAFDGAFYVWQWQCVFGEDNPIRSAAIMTLDFQPAPV